jgi:hypothetical protein
MPNGKQSKRRSRRGRRSEPRRPPMPSCAAWVFKEIAPFFRRPPLPAARSRRHLRNASIEVLEAMRDFLDEAIEWMRHEERPPEMRRIRVQG